MKDQDGYFYIDENGKKCRNENTEFQVTITFHEIFEAKNKEEAEQIFLLEYNNVKLKNIDFEVVVTE